MNENFAMSKVGTEVFNGLFSRMNKNFAMSKVVYFFLLADGKATEEEISKFDELLKALNVSDKESITNQCNQVLSQSLDESDRYEVIKEGLEKILPDGSDVYNTHSEISSFTTAESRKLLWMCVNISYSDGVCSDIEEKLLRYVARRLGIDISILVEMEDSAMTLSALENKKTWAKNCGQSYIATKAIIDEIDHDKENVIKSLDVLIIAA